MHNFTFLRELSRTLHPANNCVGVRSAAETMSVDGVATIAMMASHRTASKRHSKQSKQTVLEAEPQLGDGSRPFLGPRLDFESGARK